MKKIKLIKICAWCNKKLGFCFVKGNHNKDLVYTYGMCVECFEKIESDSLKIHENIKHDLNFSALMLTTKERLEVEGKNFWKEKVEVG